MRFGNLASAFQVILDDPFNDSVTGCGCNTSGNLELFRLSLFDFPAGQCFGFNEGSVVDSFGNDFFCAGRFLLGGAVAINASLQTVVSSGSSIPLTGWTYTVSDAPSSFYLRISNSLKSYLITGMDVINGDYELELDDEADCTKSGIEFLTFDITAQEYQVSLSSPCTIVPVGMEIAATARLALPPTSAGVVVTIRIPGEIDKSILIDDWVPFGCEGYTEDAYIDHESTECFGNPDPILTLTQSPILG
ncbi:MAG TPA: hypothetical protein VKP88_01495 [Candidatus Paceibacterota bacterium]|nr:hypothetical protein [Candidatus Paceibacterota bacterium]